MTNTRDEVAIKLGKGAFVSDENGNPIECHEFTWNRNRFGQYDTGVIYITTPIPEEVRQ